MIEIAAGMSGRGLRMAEKYGDRITYIETDLPEMAALKRSMLENAQLLSAHHTVIEMDALADDGPGSLTAIMATLDSSQGLAIITEGLMNYLEPDTAISLWQRIAQQLQAFPQGLYLADAFLKTGNQGLSSRFLRAILQRFVSGGLYVHYDSEEEAERVTVNAGFKQATMHHPRDLEATQALGNRRGGDRVRVLEAWA